PWHASGPWRVRVSRAAQDPAGHQNGRAGLYPKRPQREMTRRTLDGPQRHRRYQVEDEIADAESEVRGLVGELEALGVALLDGSQGLVGFPTRVNDRPAYFSWMPGEDGLGYWNYAGDHNRRPVPHDWTQPPAPRPRSRKSKK